MNPEFFGVNSPFLLGSNHATWTRVVGQPLLTKPTGFMQPLDRHPCAEETSAANGSSTPEKQFQTIIEFIDTTSRLSADQLRWLAFLEPLVEPAKHNDLDRRVEETINRNTELLAEAIMDLTRQGKPLKIGHPQSGRSVCIIGMGYSTEQLGYQVAIPEPTAAAPTLIPLFTSAQLHL